MSNSFPTNSSGGPRNYVPLMVPKVTSVSFGNTTSLLVAANPDRFYLGLAFVLSGMSATYKPGTPITGSEGYQTGTSNILQEFFFSRHGGLVQTDWYVKGSGFSGICNVIEGLWLPQNG